MATKIQKYTTGQFIIYCIVTAIFFPAVILGLGGNWLWVEGWIFGLWLDAMVLLNVTYMYKHNPDLLSERAKAPGSDNQKKWDKYLLTAIYILSIVLFVLMPLDAERFKWSPEFPIWLKAVGGVLLVPALYLMYKPTVENTYLSTLVRIQDDRKQRVISTGVYSFVRHPLYLGDMLLVLGAPLLLGSVIGLILWAIALAAIVGRITGEERMLAEELEGYEGYKQKVKYRLLPGIW